MTDLDPLGAALESAWQRTDQLFALLVDEALYARPIPLRHPFVFYLGHLPAFAWNQVCGGLLQQRSFNPGFDDLFARGIDPTPGEAERLAEEVVRWPRIERIVAYRDQVRDALRNSRDAIRDLADRHIMARGDRILHCVLEHELTHHETLLYLVQQLEGRGKRPPAALPPLSFATAASSRTVRVPAGRARLGADFDQIPFGWDNEFPTTELDVPAFRMDTTPVMNGEFFEFVDGGAYDDAAHWGAADWAWRKSVGLQHPLFWRRVGSDWVYRGLFEDLPLTRVFDWPVYVSWAEAAAFLAWKGQRLPTEAEFHRAAYGTPEDRQRRHPWGDDPITPARANLHFHHWSPTPVGSHPDGASAFGIQELVGNGWEWTCTPFRPFEGFQAYMPDYPGYSADFFAEPHYVMLGGSWATDARLVRPSFRNWFRPHYPYVFAKFRGVSSAG